MKAFADLGDFPNCSESVLPTLEEFVCRIYGSKQIKSINEMRLDLFSKAHKFMDNEDLFCIKTKNFDALTLPPCQSELYQCLLRRAYITKIWKNAHSQCPTELSPIEHGSEESDEIYNFKWFENDQLPATVSDILLDTESNNDEGMKNFLIQFRTLIFFK